MLEGKTPIESFHFIVRAHALTAKGFYEACDYFEKEKNEKNLNLDEKIIIACCLRKIHIASMVDKDKEEVALRRIPAEEFYLENYDKCAQGTRDYMADYEAKMQREREMFKDLDAYVEQQNRKINKVYVYKKKS